MLDNIIRILFLTVFLSSAVGFIGTAITAIIG